MKPAILLWENKNGGREWRAFTSWESMKLHISTLFAIGVDPAKILVPSSLYWLFPSRHNGRRMVSQRDVLDIVAGYVPEQQPFEQTDKSEEYSESSLIGNSELGWIAPDGRFFSCEYGGHAGKAREIVGYLENVPNAQGLLESKGWFAIYRNPSRGKTLCIGSGKDVKKISAAQFQTIQGLGITAKIANLSDYL